MMMMLLTIKKNEQEKNSLQEFNVNECGDDDGDGRWKGNEHKSNSGATLLPGQTSAKRLYSGECRNKMRMKCVCL